MLGHQSPLTLMSHYKIKWLWHFVDTTSCIHFAVFFVKLITYRLLIRKIWIGAYSKNFYRPTNCIIMHNVLPATWPFCLYVCLYVCLSLYVAVVICGLITTTHCIVRLGTLSSSAIIVFVLHQTLCRNCGFLWLLVLISSGWESYRMTGYQVVRKV